MVRLYIISIVCIVCYFLMENNNVINQLVEKSSNFRYYGFVTLVFTGLLQYGLLTVGICIFITLSYIIIREKIKND
ncbi:hypothetical protein BTR34_09055 [Maribacter hydrothermalis]|nr:hypothetical protein BTR34_09055 [Maribacter hydrothermalis]